jgi:threonine/homoserine/homoserine lactone efflux protein
MNIPAIILGIVAGFVLAMPPGPISLAATRQVLLGSFRAGLLMVIAAAIMDMVFMLGATFASSAILVTLQGIILENKVFLLVFQLACISVLLYLGIGYFVPKRREHREEVVEQREMKEEEQARHMVHSSPFLIGGVMAVANLASPSFFPSFLAVVSFLQANHVLMRTSEDNILFSIGFGSGTLLWFLTAMRILAYFRAKLTDGFLGGIYKFAGGSMLLFAVLVGYHVITHTDWSGLFH